MLVETIMSTKVKIAAAAGFVTPWSTQDETAFIIDSGEIDVSANKIVVYDGPGQVVQVVWKEITKKVTFKFTAKTASFPKATEDAIGEPIEIVNDPILAGTYHVDNVKNAVKKGELMEGDLECTYYAGLSMTTTATTTGG
jgi:hypothetical protein